MRLLLRLVAVVVAVLSVLSRASAAPPPASPAADFAWFDSLAYPSPKELTFVRFPTEWTTLSGSEKYDPNWGYGWLLQDFPVSFRVRTLDFRELEFSKLGVDWAARRFYEKFDFAQYAREQMKEPPVQAIFAEESRTGPKYPRRTRLFLLAWTAGQRELPELAAQLHDLATRTRERRPDMIDPGEVNGVLPPFRPRLERDLAQFDLWSILVAFRNPAISRSELLGQLQTLARRYPQHEHASYAQELTTSLQAMLAGDKAHPPLSAEEIRRLPLQEQIRGWIFQLRNECAHQPGQHGVEVFWNFDSGSDTPPTPAHRLAYLGEAALPALLEALGDSRLTRSVAHEQPSQFSHYVLTVGDVALQTIEKITGRTFFKPNKPEATMSQEGKTVMVQTAIEEWLRKWKANGPVAELSAATILGDKDAVEAGRRLLKAYPKEAVTPLLSGAAAAKIDWVRSQFIELLCQLKDESATEFLLQEVRNGPFTGPRAQAALHLSLAGRTEALPLLAAAWKTSKPEFGGDAHDNRDLLIFALLLADSPLGFQALAESLRDRTPATRDKILFSLLPDSRQMLTYRMGNLGTKPKPEAKLSPDTLQALEELLVAELKDDGIPASWGTMSVKDVEIAIPRLCDLAAINLWLRWPKKYPFDPAAPFVVREQQRITLLNIARTARQLPPLPPPPARPVVPRESADLIAGVYFADRALDVPPAVLTLLREAKGRPFDIAFYQEVRKAFTSAYPGHPSPPPPPHHSFALWAFREKDNRGVSLVAAPIQRFYSPEDGPREWRISATARLGGEKPLSGIEFSIFDPDPRRSTGDHTIEEVLAHTTLHPPDQPFWLVLEFCPEGGRADAAY